MPIKPDRWIEKMSRERGMIEPFEPRQVKKGISYGLSSYGYDFRLSDTFKVLQTKDGAVLDPKNFDALTFEEVKADFFDIPSGSYCLGRSLEYFRIPRNILTICYGKSTYARCGVSIHVTPFEPEWEGYVTIAIVNNGPIPARVYANEGIGQVLFLESDEACAVSYADKKGKYQAQKEITGAKI